MNMTKMISYLILLMVFPTVIFAGDFRDASWGITQKQVLNLEKDKKNLSNQNDRLLYKGTIGGMACTYGYDFIKDKLVSGMYIITERHMNANLYIDDYDKLQKLLIKKYGDPKLDRQIWENELFKENQDHWGTAVSTGALQLGSTWENDDTEVLLVLAGDNFEVQLAIKYASKKFKSETDKAKEQKDLGGL